MQRESQGDRQVVRIIHKSEKQRIEVSLTTFRGRTFGDVRLYILNPEGSWIPTRKGITIDVKQLEQLEEAVGSLLFASDPRVRGRCD